MEYDIEKIGKEIVVGRFRELNDPYTLAGEAARKIAVAAVISIRGRQEPRVTVAATCRGVLAGMLLIDKDLVSTVIAVLSQMATIAQDANLDPADCMIWAMEGIVPIVKMSSDSTGDKVRDAIEANFMGAGEVFDRVFRTAGA